MRTLTFIRFSLATLPDFIVQRRAWVKIEANNLRFAVENILI